MDWMKITNCWVLGSTYVNNMSYENHADCFEQLPDFVVKKSDSDVARWLVAKALAMFELQVQDERNAEIFEQFRGLEQHH